MLVIVLALSVEFNHTVGNQMNLEEVNALLESIDAKCTNYISFIMGLVTKVSKFSFEELDNFLNMYDSKHRYSDEFTKKFFIDSSTHDIIKDKYLRIYFNEDAKKSIEITLEMKNAVNKILDNLVIDTANFADIQHFIDYTYVNKKLSYLSFNNLSFNKNFKKYGISTLCKEDTFFCESLLKDLEPVVSEEAKIFSEKYVEIKSQMAMNPVPHMVSKFQYKMEILQKLNNKIKEIIKENNKNLLAIQNKENYNQVINELFITNKNFLDNIDFTLKSINSKSSFENDFERHMKLTSAYIEIQNLQKKIDMLHKSIKENEIRIKQNNTLTFNRDLIITNAMNDLSMSDATYEKNSDIDNPIIPSASHSTSTVSASAPALEEDNLSAKTISESMTFDEMKDRIKLLRLQRKQEQEQRIKEKQEIKQKLIAKAQEKYKNNCENFANVFISSEKKLDKKYIDMLTKIITEQSHMQYRYQDFTSLAESLGIRLENNGGSHVGVNYNNKYATILKTHGKDIKMPQPAVDIFVEALWNIDILQGDIDLARGNKNNIKLYIKSLNNELELLHEPKQFAKVTLKMI